jgi:hypothetical protein
MSKWMRFRAGVIARSRQTTFGPARARRNAIPSLIYGAALVICSLLVSSCATSSVESRKQERAAAYSALSPEDRQLVDQGQIKVGMSPDAVFLSWGRPDEVLENETREGHATIWLYTGTVMQETRHWSYRELSRGGRPFLGRVVESDYNPQDYVRAEIVFVNGVVNSWRTLPRPLN